jgi:hypothetical protein
MSSNLDRLSALSGRINAESTFDRLKEDSASNPEILAYLEAELMTLERYTATIKRQIALVKGYIATDEKSAKVSA